MEWFFFGIQISCLRLGVSRISVDIPEMQQNQAEQVKPCRTKCRWNQNLKAQWHAHVFSSIIRCIASPIAQRDRQQSNLEVNISSASAEIQSGQHPRFQVVAALTRLLRTFQLDEFSTGEGKSVSALEYFRVQIAYLGRLTDLDPICALRNTKFAKHKFWRRWLCQFGLSRPLYVISRSTSASQHSAVVTAAFHALSAVKFQANWFHALFFQYSWWRK
ncbi:Hypothetical_protein [Hexamita inflata]|uniref:Hypothetical_protein n=1 Tax=Hexamita inflata TaxID=28002 RepID=A0AA86UZG9_9EUKA|nr:Hypothetical protein HINF_LOCUS58022 [Hexamita inflata]